MENYDLMDHAEQNSKNTITPYIPLQKIKKVRKKETVFEIL